tara:strand:+ start:895 stop:1077 length:183 start_codon:yes stop_codon:yes gene_type:complete
MTGKIGEYTFELDSELGRIDVYQKGDAVEPGWHIAVGRNVDEKTFHYEIMDWYVKRGTAS